MCLFQIEKKVFQFERSALAGQYVFPFTFKLPNNIPNSFKTKMTNEEVYSIQYNLRAYFEAEEPVLQYSKTIIVNKEPSQLKSKPTPRPQTLNTEDERKESEKMTGRELNPKNMMGEDKTFNEEIKEIMDDEEELGFDHPQQNINNQETIKPKEMTDSDKLDESRFHIM